MSQLKHNTFALLICENHILIVYVSYITFYIEHFIHICNLMLKIRFCHRIPVLFAQRYLLNASMLNIINYWICQHKDGCKMTQWLLGYFEMSSLNVSLTWKMSRLGFTPPLSLPPDEKASSCACNLNVIYILLKNVYKVTYHVPNQNLSSLFH